MHRRILYPRYNSLPLAICRYGGDCLTNLDQFMMSNDANDATDIGFFDLPVERWSAGERDLDHTTDKRIPRPRRPPTGGPDLPVDQGNAYKSTPECDVKRRVWRQLTPHVALAYYYRRLLLLIWQSPGLPGWRKVNLITVTRRPLHPSIAAGFYCLTTSPGFLPALCEKWSGFFYVHRVWLSYTRDWRLKVSSERLGNEDKAPCPRALLPGRGSNRGPPVWKSEVLTAQPRQLLWVWYPKCRSFLDLAS